ncbi:chromosome alignment-maintaining phosphoprotein 1 [Phyllobates terribilis]|uniref:chromosome alignment-maintaining phosphoprotein 1 n=1 Tax=Phyllobates terribilis TaxID=111132 RepID=UPI003CCAD9E5
MEVLQKHNELDCNRCSFHGTDYKSVQIHMGTIHPEFCEEIDTGGLGKLVFYQKSARLFHCHRCFFTSKMFSSVYYHILGQHAEPDKLFNKLKPIKEPKSEQGLFLCSEKNDSEHMVSEDEKSVDEKFKLKEVKSEENDTLTSWPENVSCQVTHDNSDIEFKSGSSSSSSIEKARTIFQETKDSSCDPESSSSSDNISTAKSVQANAGVEFSDNDIASSPSKDIPEFSDEDDEPALPGGIPQFSDDETVTQSKDAQEASEDVLHDQSRGIEDISEDEMPLEEKLIENISEDESAPAQSKLEDVSEEEDMLAPAKEMMEFSDDDEEDNLALSKEDMEFSDDEEANDKPKNVETNASKNVMDFSEEEETTTASRNVMEFSEEEETPGLSKEIMDFSEDDEDDDDDDDAAAPAMPKSIMEFSEEEDISPQSKDMPKYLEGNSTPTQSKDSEYVEDAMSLFKGSSPFSEYGAPDEFTPNRPKDFANKSKGLPGTSRLSVATNFSDCSGTPSWSKDGLDTSDSGDISLSAPDTYDVSDDKDSFLKEEEILKHVKRIKGKFQCMLCDYRPLKRGPILNHLITKHNMPSPFICKICGETFAVETHLKNHSSAHTKGLYKCQKCNFQTDYPRGFKKHQTHCESRRHYRKGGGNKPVVDLPPEEHEEH